MYETEWQAKTAIDGITKMGFSASFAKVRIDTVISTVQIMRISYDMLLFRLCEAGTAQCTGSPPASANTSTAPILSTPV